MVHRKRDGSIVKCPAKVVRPEGVRGDAWQVAVGWGKTTKDHYAHQHSALMPESLARDLILSWSRPGDLILDPMAGAATTCKMALLNHRDYLGFEVHPEYHVLAVRRMDDAHAEYRHRLDDWLVAGPSASVRCRRPEGGYEVIYADPPCHISPGAGTRRACTSRTIIVRCRWRTSWISPWAT